MKIIIGSYTEKLSDEIIGKGAGILVYDFNESDLGLRLLSVTKQKNPAYLVLNRDQNMLYTAEELNAQDHPELFSYQLNDDYSLTRTDSISITGSLACHINLRGPDILIANYGSGDVLCYRTKKGQFIGQKNQFQHFGKSVNELRQYEPHAHMVCFANEGEFYVPDLGIDKCVAYGYVGDEIVPKPKNDLILPDGEGPRHMVVSHNAKFIYVLSELTGKVSTFDTKSKRLIQQIDSLPKHFLGVPSGAAIRLHPNGRYLYVSNREINILTSFDMLENGQLVLKKHIDLTDKTPREFNISPDGKHLIVAGQDSHTLSFYKLQENGDIEFIKTFEGIKSPSCILFLN